MLTSRISVVPLACFMLVGIPAATAAASDNKGTSYAERINKHFGKGVSVENNAMILIMEALGPKPEGTELPDAYFESLGMRRPADDGQYFQPFAVGMKPPAQATAIEEFGKATDGPWKEEDLPTVAAWLKANESVVATVEKAVQRSQWHYPLIPAVSEDGEPEGLIATLLPQIQQLRSLARYFISRAYRRIEQGNPDAAWKDLMSCHRLGRLSSHGPTLIDYLVGVAISSMAMHGEVVLLDQCTLTDAQLKSYAADLRALPSMADPADTVRVTERYMFMDTVDLIAKGGIDGLDDMIGLNVGPITPVHRMIMSVIDWNAVKRRGHVAYNRLDRVVSIGEPGSRQEAFEVFDKSMESMRKETGPSGFLRAYIKTGSLRDAISGMAGNTMIQLLLPAIKAVDGARTRHFQVDVNLQLAFALQRYKAQQGEYPESLAELTPDFANVIPADAFNGKELNYRRTNSGYLLYSVGQNRKDENGKTFGEAEGADDLVVKMPRKSPQPSGED